MRVVAVDERLALLFVKVLCAKDHPLLRIEAGHEVLQVAEPIGLEIDEMLNNKVALRLGIRGQRLDVLNIVFVVLCVL